MIFLGISTTVGSINFIVTLLRTRAPGHVDQPAADPGLGHADGLGRATCSRCRRSASPSSCSGSTASSARISSTSPSGGQPLLWQHLFWMFGHPVGLRDRAAGDGHRLRRRCRSSAAARWSATPPVALATVATMMLGFGVWVHHMFATGLPALALSFFSARQSIVIAIPSAVAVFAWIATIWTGRPVFTTPFLFFAGFIVLFVIGGVSGFMTAAVPVDWQLTDTYFVVAHLHYVLIGINVFPVIGGIYYWFPEDHRPDARRAARAAGTSGPCSSASTSASSRCTSPGLLGMPRRIYTYPRGIGWDTLNLITTLGAFVFALGVLLFLINVGPQPASRRASPGPIRGMRRRSNGRRRRRRRRTTSRHPDRRQPPSAVGGPAARKRRALPARGRHGARPRPRDARDHAARRRARRHPARCRRIPTRRSC